MLTLCPGSLHFLAQTKGPFPVSGEVGLLNIYLAPVKFNTYPHMVSVNYM